MDIAMFAVLIATMMPCSDVQSIIDNVRADRYFLPGVAVWATTHFVVFQSIVVFQIPVEQGRPC